MPKTTHARTRAKKKRGRKWMISGDSRASTCKRGNHRQALTTDAVLGTATPGPDPGPAKQHANHNPNQSPHQSPHCSQSWIELTRRHDCPITGCDNWGGKGYMDSTIIKHLNSHSNVIRDSATEKARALEVASRIGTYHSCDRCGKLYLIALRSRERTHLPRLPQENPQTR